MKKEKELKAISIKFPEAIYLCSLIEKNGGEARIIGGAVRDALLALDIHDVDIATNLLPREVEEILEKNNIKCLLHGKNFGTIVALINNKQFEVTTLRKDIECDGRWAKVEFSRDWLQDAARRDFTINAMSLDLRENLYDYFNGLDHLKQRKVKFIGNAEDRIEEDYLRILRFFRFSSYFAENIEAEGLAACIAKKSGLKKISFERFKSELYKIFQAPKSIETLDIMQQNSIIESSEQNIIALKRLYKLFNEFNYFEPSLCWALMFYQVTQEKFCLNSSVFNRKEKKQLKLLSEAASIDFHEDILLDIWQAKKENFLNFILLVLSLNKKEINDELISKVKAIANTKILPLPINGDDLIKLGFTNGKMIGEALEKADKLWYKNSFRISRENLIHNIERLKP